MSVGPFFGPFVAALPSFWCFSLKPLCAEREKERKREREKGRKREREKERKKERMKERRESVIFSLAKLNPRISTHSKLLAISPMIAWHG